MARLSAIFQLVEKVLAFNKQVLFRKVIAKKISKLGTIILVFLTPLKFAHDYTTLMSIVTKSYKEVHSGVTIMPNFGEIFPSVKTN
jgi:hypothetical protein